MKLDLHLHSEYSWDSTVEIQDYIELAMKKKFDVISITDHNNTESHNVIKDLQETTSVLLIPGQEISTADGHLLVYGWGSDIPTDLSMVKTVDIASFQNCICIAAHPFDPFRGGSFSRIFESDIRGFETLNASAWFGFPNWLARRAARSRPSMATLGNSDAHRLEEFGSAYSVLPDDIDLTILNILDKLSFCEPKGKRIGVLRKTSRFLQRKFI